VQIQRGTVIRRLVALVLLLSLSLQWTAQDVFATAYTYDCDSGTMPAAQYHMYVHKETANSTDEFNGVIGEAYARDRATCFAGNPKHGFSAIFPANLQQLTTGGGLVQVGIYEDSGMDSTTMVYTPWDHAVANQCGGQPGCLAVADWYHSGGPVCTTCLYRFRIQAIGNPQVPNWELCIRNVSNGESYVCKTIARTWGAVNYAKLAWWTYETQNSADAIGRTNVGLIHLRWLQYRRESDGVWMVRTNMGNEPPPYDYNNQGGCRGWASTPSYYDCGISNEIDQDGNGHLDDHDGLDAWTVLH
jgi:hypothetical protein